MKKADLGALCVCSVRYSLGRHTYMPSVIQRIVKENIEDLSYNDIFVIHRDVEKYIQNNTNIADDIDFPMWKEFCLWLQQVLDKRCLTK